MPISGSSINIHLHLAEATDGLSVTILEINPIKPSPQEDWYTHASTSGAETPFTVDIKKREGWFCELTLSSEKIFASGTGPSFEIKFRVTGTVDGKDILQDGWITVQTTEWGLTRPDQVLIAYGFDGGSAPHTMRVVVQNLQSPDPARVHLAFDSVKSKLGMHVSTHREVINKILDLMLAGVFWGHQKAADWVFGKVF